MFEDYPLWVRLLQAGYQSANCDEILLLMRTPADMYKRRGGTAYTKNMLEFYWWMYKEGWSSIVDFGTGALPYTVIYILQNGVRKGV